VASERKDKWSGSIWGMESCAGAGFRGGKVPESLDSSLLICYPI
jgi:hypothetical protein